MLAISVNSSIVWEGMRGGSRVEKKSFKAVATALTGMSNSRIEILGSRSHRKKVKRWCYQKTTNAIMPSCIMKPEDSRGTTDLRQNFGKADRHELCSQGRGRFLPNPSLPLQ